MWTRNRPQLTSTCIAFVLSLMAHGLMGLYLSVFVQPPPTAYKDPTPTKVTVPFLSEREVENRRKYRRLKPKEPPKKEEPPPPKEKIGQVVEIPPPEVEEVPKEARFRSEYNSAVDRELIHQNKVAPQPKMRRSERVTFAGGDDEQGSRQGKRGVRAKARRGQTPAKKAGQTKKRSKKRRRMSKNRRGSRPKPAKKSQQKKSLIKRGDGPFKALDVTKESTRPHINKKQGETASVPFGGGAISPTHYQSLLPTLGPQDLQRLDGSIDHVENTKEGDRTALNTREYRYAYFFNRVKREVSKHWDAVQRLRRSDPRGRVYGVRDRRTVLMVTLHASGKLVDVEVEVPSGVALLDQAAVHAFLRAQPFHNPPKGLLDSEGLVRFKFGFFLEINGRQFRLLP